MRRTLLTLIVAMGCAGDAQDTGEGPPPVCNVLEDGQYDATGPGFGMPMTVWITFDLETCRGELYDWNMAHGQPTFLTIDEDEVQLGGSTHPESVSAAYWASCVGTLAEDGRRVEGRCTESKNQDGAFVLSLVDP